MLYKDASDRCAYINFRGEACNQHCFGQTCGKHKKSAGHKQCECGEWFSTGRSKSGCCYRCSQKAYRRKYYEVKGC